MKLWFVCGTLIAVGALCVGCPMSNLEQPQPNPQPQPRTQDSALNKIGGPIEIKIDWTEEGRIVSLEPGGAGLKSMAEIRAAAPDLHKRYENAGNLAYMAHTLYPGISTELFRTRASYQEWWKKWFEPDDFFVRNQAYIAVKPAGIDPTEIKDAAIVDGKLTYFSARVIAIDHGIQVFRNEVDFSSEDWNPNITELTTSSQVRKSIDDRATALFGGMPEGFVYAKAEGGDLYLAAKPGTGASPFVWQTRENRVEHFNSWASLVAKHPEAGSSAIAAELAEGISNYPLSSSSHLLRDTEAYKKEYKEGNWDLEKLRYWVDQMRVTRYTVTDWDNIVDPFIKDGVLVAHFRRGRQPARMTYSLDQFAQQPEHVYEDLFTSKLISDTKHGPMDLPEQEPPDEELQVNGIIQKPQIDTPKLSK